jgi:hypothetical protein
MIEHARKELARFKPRDVECDAVGFYGAVEEGAAAVVVVAGERESKIGHGSA